MKIATMFNLLDGKVVKDTEVYRVVDNNALNNLTVSTTDLKPNKETSGHKHDGLEEVYVFVLGNGTMQVGEKKFEVFGGDVISVPAGAFHKVFAGDHGVYFLAIFQAYQR